MDSDASSYLLNHAAIPTEYCVGKEDASIIDLGLSLRALPAEVYNPSSTHDWQQFHPQLRRPDNLCVQNMKEVCDQEESEGIESKNRKNFVKVNMDGLIVGRKICVLDHMDYWSLALQLEDMFGMQSTCGLRLLQDESEFSLFYKDRDDQWRTIGDIPWKQFVECVKRLRIARKDKPYGINYSSALLHSI